MSSYIIAGSANSTDTAYCQQIARRIKAKYSNIDFRVVIKHPSEWDEYLQQICRIYGFLKKSNPIVYTFDGKVIGNRDAFVALTTSYFGLDEERLIVQDLSNKVNMKLAEEEIKRKRIIKDNFKTIPEKIDAKYQQLLKKKLLRHELKQQKDYLVHGIQYIERQVVGMVRTMRFVQQLDVPVDQEEVKEEEINLIALALADQVKLEGEPTKQPVPANDKQHTSSEQDKMSEASRTNKLHESMLSYDKDSKVVKQSNQTNLRIAEENEAPDYIDEPVGEYFICSLTDDFHVALSAKSHVTAEMIFYHNEDSNGNSQRIHNDNRPIKGHHTLVKEVHYENQVDIQGANEEQEVDDQLQLHQSIQGTKQPDRKDQHDYGAGQKSKTEPNILMGEPESGPMLNDAISERHTDLNLLSHLNYHTLFVQKPLSPIELKNLMYFIRETNTIACLQFLPENPNPKLKLYHRKYLLKEASTVLLPVERFIAKQIEDREFNLLTVPATGSTQRTIDVKESYSLIQINELGFQHYIYQLHNPKEYNQEQIARVIKHTVDDILLLEDQLRREVGYNLVLTDQILMLVPIVQPYLLYDSHKIYFDGLAYMGLVHTPKLAQPYTITHPSLEKNGGIRVRQSLARCSGANPESS